MRKNDKVSKYYILNHMPPFTFNKLGQTGSASSLYSPLHNLNPSHHHRHAGSAYGLALHPLSTPSLIPVKTIWLMKRARVSPSNYFQLNLKCYRCLVCKRILVKERCDIRVYQLIRKYTRCSKLRTFAGT